MAAGDQTRLGPADRDGPRGGADGDSEVAAPRAAGRRQADLEMTASPRSRWGGGVGVIVLFLVVLTLATARGGDPALYPARPGQGVLVYLVDNGWHSDIAVPTATIEARGDALASAARQTSSAPWMLIGWGDARFYEASTSALSRIPDGLRALAGGRP